MVAYVCMWGVAVVGLVVGLDGTAVGVMVVGLEVGWFVGVGFGWFLSN